MDRIIIYLNDRPFELTLPTGGNDLGTSSEWESALDFGGKFKTTYKDKPMSSWCREVSVRYPNKYIIRGFDSPRRWGYGSEILQNMNIGYRPVLLPLNPDTFLFDSSIFECLNKKTIKMGVLVVNENIISKPSNYVYKRGDRIQIKDDKGSDKGRIEWLVFEGKLIAVKNLVINVSRRQLVNMELVGGEKKRDITDPILDLIIRGENIGSDYVLLTLPVSLNWQEQEKLSPNGEVILSLVAVDKVFLTEFIKKGPYKNLEDFYKNYNIDDEVLLENMARRVNAVAFSYRPMCDNTMVLGETMDKEKFQVLVNFINKYFSSEKGSF